MSVVATAEGTVCVLTIDGELSRFNVDEFRNQVEQSLAGDGRDFVVDFAEATGIDSAGLEALTWLKRECDERLGMIKLCSLSAALRKILEMTRLDRRFALNEHVDEALKSFV